jgi:tRNA (Thr-GGU) A37 N-methylase
MRAIGIVRTEYQDPESTPIQAAVSRAEHAKVELLPEYREGLDGLAEFDYAWLITWLRNREDPAATPAMRQVPFLLRPQQRRLGVFASRGPRRVNSIGLSLIQLQRVSYRVQLRRRGPDRRHPSTRRQALRDSLRPAAGRRRSALRLVRHDSDRRRQHPIQKLGHPIPIDPPT